MKKETLLEVVSELVGYTEPYGDTDVDETRYENQEKIITLVENGIEDLIKNAEYRKSSEYSASQIGGRAYETLEKFYKVIGNSIEEMNAKMYKYNFPYELLAVNTMRELSKSNDKEVICKFVEELCKLSKLRQYSKYKTPKLEKGSKYENRN